MKTLSCILSVLFCFSAYAQKGMVVDQKTGKEISPDKSDNSKDDESKSKEDSKPKKEKKTRKKKTEDNE